MTRLLRFSVVGLVNTGVGLSCIWGAMYFLHLGVVPANFLGYLVGLIVSFALNRSWTFTDKGPIAKSFPRWVALVVIAYLGNLAIVVAAHRYGGVDAYVAQTLGIIIYAGITYLGLSRFVFTQQAMAHKRAL